MKHKIKLSEIQKFTYQNAQEITALVGSAIQNQIGLTKHFDPKTGKIVNVLTIMTFEKNDITDQTEVHCFCVSKFDPEDIEGLISIEDFEKIELTDEQGNVINTKKDVPIIAHSLFPHTHGPDCRCEKSKLIKMIESLMFPILIMELDKVKEIIDKVNGAGWGDLSKEEIQENLMGEVFKALNTGDPTKN